MSSLSPSRRVIELLSAVALLLWTQQSSGAAIAAEGVVNPLQAALPVELPAIAFPELPPLGGADLYLPKAEVPMRLVIKLGERRVYVYQGEQVKATYPIAVGKAGWETPTGAFEVRQMVIDPAWEHPWNGKIVPPGPENPLGRRWIGFWTDGRNSIGFHGTTNEALIGQPVSHGCVRMRNRDVEALFETVAIGTPVVVQP